MNKEMFEVYGFKNTGFSVGNSPSSVNLLMSTPNISDYIVKIEPIYKLQPFILDTIEINKTFNEIQGLDYIIIQSLNSVYDRVGYYVTGINMINVNTASVSLLIDSIGTIGIGVNDKYELTTGWTTRRHYTTKEDTLFANVLPESFTPSQPTKMKSYEIGYTNGRTNLIASTMNLGDRDINIIIDEIQNSKAIIEKPIIDGTPRATRVTLPENKATGGFTQQVQSLGIYDGSLLGQKTLNKLQAYGLIDCITASYQVPSELLSTSSKAGAFFTTISGTGKGYENTGLVYQIATVKNKKVLSKASVFTLLSPISGDSETFEGWEIYNPEHTSSPTFTLMADVTPGGRPYCRPTFYRGLKGEGQFSYYKTVKGAIWNNVPIITNGENAYALNKKLENISEEHFIKEKSTLENMLINDKIINENNHSQTIAGLNIDIAKSQREKEFHKNMRGVYADLDSAMANSGNSIFNVAGTFASEGLSKIGLKNREKLDNKYASIKMGVAGYNTTINNNSYKAMNDNLYNTQQNLKRQDNIYNATVNKMEIQNQLSLSRLETNRNREIAEFNNTNMVKPPNYTFAGDSGLQNFLGNGFVVMQEYLSESDIKRFDDYLTYFGYSVSEPIQTNFFTNRLYYNYISANNVRIKSINGNLPQYILDNASNQLTSGVRIWHTLPNKLTRTQIYDNPSK